MSCGLLLTFQARELQLAWKGTFSSTTYPITLGKWALRYEVGTGEKTQPAAVVCSCQQQPEAHVVVLAAAATR